jgi:hypothetical protein
MPAVVNHNRPTSYNHNTRQYKFLHSEIIFIKSHCFLERTKNKKTIGIFLKKFLHSEIDSP